MNIINLTPHEISIYGHETQPQWVIPPSGQVARATETREELPPVIPGMPVFRMSFGAVENLPDPQPETIYLVSGLVLTRCAGRSDVFVPGEAIRDDKGRVIGCVGLSAAPQVAPRWTDEQISILVGADATASDSYGYGGWVTDALRKETSSNPLEAQIIEWAERHTPTAPEWFVSKHPQAKVNRNRLLQETTVKAEGMMTIFTISPSASSWEDVSAAIDAWEEKRPEYDTRWDKNLSHAENEPGS